MTLLALWCGVPTIINGPYPYQAIILICLEVLAVIAYRLGVLPVLAPVLTANVYSGDWSENRTDGVCENLWRSFGHSHC